MSNGYQSNSSHNSIIRAVLYGPALRSLPMEVRVRVVRAMRPVLNRGLQDQIQGFHGPLNRVQRVPSSRLRLRNSRRAAARLVARGNARRGRGRGG